MVGTGGGEDRAGAGAARVDAEDEVTAGCPYGTVRGPPPGCGPGAASRRGAARIVAPAPGAAAARAAAGAAGYGGAPGSVVAVGPDDGAAEILAKAARVVPRAPQVARQEREITGFTHFGMNTFTDHEWGSGCEDEALFSTRRPPTSNSGCGRTAPRG
ncbi:hypothetical protein GCM10023082_60420 [Streptomyces tremellae]|uniref:Uncharacterized protein n=1 Tax=Streptomyces tremellae TaxID=1124239 RepID=A0ABP7G8T5_9ACTN